MGKDIAKLLASKFVARPDVKAIQRTSGAYNPALDPVTQKPAPFTMDDFLDHLDGKRTYGHYLLNKSSEAKFFAFDIDLDEVDPNREKAPEHYKHNPDLLLPNSMDEYGVFGDFTHQDPRHIWLDRKAKVQRTYLKLQMKMIASRIVSVIEKDFEIPTAVTYTGAKGLHVYGFTGLLPAKDVREGAELVLKKLDTYEHHIGNNFFKHKKVLDGSGDVSPEESFQCFTIEVFPKQTEIQAGGYGNLMRLPLGKNLKNPNDPTFFVDMRDSLGSLTPRDAVDALTTPSQWR